MMTFVDGDMFISCSFLSLPLYEALLCSNIKQNLQKKKLVVFHLQKNFLYKCLDLSLLRLQKFKTKTL